MNQENWGNGGGYGPPGSGGYGGGYGPAPSARPPETPFFSDDKVVITSARAVIAGTTYALANVTSVRSWTVKRSALPLLLGILCLLSGIAVATSQGGCGGTIILIGVVLTLVYFLTKDRHHVRIGTAGGEVDALQSTDPAYVYQIVTALNNAIIHRG